MKKLWLTITILYLALLAFVSLVPPSAHQTGGHSVIAEVLHNAAHVPAYMILTFVLFFTLRAFDIPDPAVKRKVILMALGYGVLMEFLQGWAPDRDPSVLDAGLDLCGILLMLLFLRGTKQA